MKGLCGSESVYKQRDYRKLLGMHMRITGNVLARNEWADRRYWYFDLFAGPGRYEWEGEEIEGSPLIFQEMAQRRLLEIFGVMVERDSERYERLCELITDSRIKVYNSGNRDVVDWIVHKRKINRKYLGLLYCDPPMDKVGYEDMWYSMDQFARIAPRVDQMMYISATNMKRIRSVDVDRSRLLDNLDRINKRYKYIRELSAAFQYTFIMCSNFRGFEWKGAGFHLVDSEEGQRILSAANYTRDELRGAA